MGFHVLLELSLLFERFVRALGTHETTETAMQK